MTVNQLFDELKKAIAAGCGNILLRWVPNNNQYRLPNQVNNKFH